MKFAISLNRSKGGRKMEMLIEFPKQRVDIELEELDDWMKVYCAGNRLISLPVRLDPMSRCKVTINNIVYPNMMAAYWALRCKHDEDCLQFGMPLKDVIDDPNIFSRYDLRHYDDILDLAYASDIEFIDDDKRYSQILDTVIRETCSQNEDVLNELLETYPYPIVPCRAIYDPDMDTDTETNRLRHVEEVNRFLASFTAVLINVRADLVQNDHLNADKYVSRGVDDLEREHIHDWVFNKPWHCTFEEYKDSISPRAEAERQLKDYIESAKECNTTVTSGEVELNWLANTIISSTMRFYNELRLDKTTLGFMHALFNCDYYFDEETKMWKHKD